MKLTFSIYLKSEDRNCDEKPHHISIQERTNVCIFLEEYNHYWVWMTFALCDISDIVVNK
jgi:hypothetical protein